MRLKKPLILQKDLDVVSSEKKPFNKQPHVGIEIEFISKTEKFVMEQYFILNKLSDYVTIKDDGSVSGNSKYPHSYEIAIIAPQSRILLVLRKVCAILKEAKSTANKTCGLHIHLDMRNRDYEKAFLNLCNVQPLLYSMQPYSRRTNSYCRPSRMSDVTMYSGGRDGINIHSMRKHNTIEIRMHSGTIDFKKISNWVQLLIILIGYRKILNEPLFNYREVKKEFNIPSKVDGYIKKRLKTFNVKPSELVDIWNYIGE